MNEFRADPFDHNGECGWCGEIAVHAPDCEWLRHQLAQQIPPPSITCSRCGFTSFHPKDIEARYCVMCHVFDGETL